jgi:hypothetical protein
MGAQPHLLTSSSLFRMFWNMFVMPPGDCTMGGSAGSLMHLTSRDNPGIVLRHTLHDDGHWYRTKLRTERGERKERRGEWEGGEER